MKDYRKICWNCGKREMEKKNGYYQCRSCGATWNELPKLAPGVITMRKDDVLLRETSSPSFSAIKELKKMREEG